MESRVQKTLLNARVNLIFYFLQLILSFFSRKIFLDCLGADFLGLTGSLGNLLGFLNLAELGVGSAIGYLLYKPLYDHDEQKITEIISVMGYLYRWIGYIILGAGLVLGGFLPLIFPAQDTHLSYGVLFFVYFVMLSASLIGYFINYRQNLLGADQRNYVVTAYYKTMYIVKIIVQMALAYYTRNLYIWIAIEFIFGILYAIVLNRRIHHTYPWLRANVKLGKAVFRQYPDVMKKTKQVFVHKLGGFFQFQTMPFLIYSFSSLALVAFYQNYTTVTGRVNDFFSNLLTGIGASVGNLVAEGDKQKIMNVFWELQSLRFFISGFVVIPIFLLIESFIKIWLGSEYVLSNLTLILILIPLFINNVRSVLDEFNFAFGFFWDVWSPIVEIIILLGVSITMGYFYGLDGVLCGPVASLFIIMLFWKPFMLFHWGFKKNVIIYWLEYLKNIACLGVAGYISFLVKEAMNFENATNFITWCLKALPVCLVYLFSSYFIFLVFTNGMKSFNKRIKYLVAKRFRKQ